MGVRESLQAATVANLNQLGSTIILTPPGGVAQEVKGLVLRTGAEIDPESGTLLLDPKTSCTVSLEDIAGDVTEQWQAETTDITGRIITGQIVKPHEDNTIGFITFFIEASSG